ncbi:DUF4397 domain-containing protein [Desertivirga brevis]|uniref:DUF4397 domain-containing protein n=1 Tax=Desertivirga brevis TaxID=2810310 RepID=UPI001A97814C|nr:DUF4397 domain-containing protein [Pedobacter sp. SYSU D00873]
MKRFLSIRIVFITLLALLGSCKETDHLYEVPVNELSEVTLYNVAKGENEGIHRINFEEDPMTGSPKIYPGFQLGIWNESTGFISSNSSSIKPGNPVNIPTSAFTNDTLRLHFFQTGVPVVNQVISNGNKDIYYYASGSRVTHNNSRSASYALKEFPKNNEAPSPGHFKIRLLNLDYGSIFPARATAAQFCSLHLSQGRELIKDVPLGQRSAFIELPYGTYRLAVKDNDNNVRSQILSNFLTQIAGGREATTPVFLKPGGNYTVVCLTASSYSEGYHMFDIIEEKVYQQEQFGKLMFLNALPSGTSAELNIGSLKTGALAFGAFSGYSLIPSGDHPVSIRSAGQQIIEDKIEVKGNDNLTLILFEKNGKPAVKVIQNRLKTSGELAGVKTQYFNFSDAAFVTFRKNNDESIPNNQWEPGDEKTTYLQQGRTLLEQKNIQEAFIDYSAFDLEPWSDYFPVKLSAFVNASATEALPGTKIEGLELDFPFTYTQGGPEKADPDLYSVFLIGRTASDSPADKARIIVIPHSNK